MADSIVINITISGRKYSLRASTPEKEEIIRKAAAVVNKKIGSYQASYKGKSEVDLLTFVALNECITNLSNAQQMQLASEEALSLEKQLSDYNDNIENGRR